MLVEGEVIDITPEMMDAAKEYADYVKSLPGIPMIETTVRVDIDGEDLFGTADAIVADGSRMEIVDFKYGQGVGVSADSSQLRIYALGALEEVGPFNSISEVGLTIVQPRSGGIKTVNIPVSELTNWEAVVLIPAAQRLAAGDTTETPGDHCRWCVRAGECEALAALAMSNAKVAFGDSASRPDRHDRRGAGGNPGARRDDPRVGQQGQGRSLRSDRQRPGRTRLEAGAEAGDRGSGPIRQALLTSSLKTAVPRYGDHAHRDHRQRREGGEEPQARP